MNKVHHHHHHNHGHPRVLGIPIPETLVIWASPVTLTLIQIVKVI